MKKTPNTLKKRDNSSKPRNLYLRSPQDVRRLLSATINEVRRQEIAEGKARVIGYLATVILKSLELGQMEERLQAVEVYINESKNKTNR